MIEFYSISRTLIGIRTRANGVESTASHAVASVYDWHDYEISVTPGAAVFKVDGATAATLTTHLPSGALNAYFTTSGPENVPISLESLTLSLVSPITTLVEDYFTGPAGNAPDPAEFECGGPTNLNGSGELNLNTLGGVTSWVKSIDTASPNASQTLRLQFRAYAYAEEHWNPGVYGNGQPRGLRVGSDPDNVIEFYSVSRTVVGMRTRANGVESTASYPVASVYDWHDYEITVTPEGAVFKLDGTTVATIITNLPVGPLNAYFTTSGPQNVPISLESLQFALLSSTTFVRDDFAGAAGTAPDPAEFECGGPTNLNGSGELNLNTLGGVTSWVRTMDSATPTASQTLSLQFRAYAYAEEHWNPGVYGNGQPRGLRVGSDPDNVIEFYSVSRTVIGMRTRANGVESTASHAVASVYDWHDYEITVTPGAAMFKVDGSTVATLTTHLPSGPLSAYFTTSGPQNVPISLESLEFIVVPKSAYSDWCSTRFSAAQLVDPVISGPMASPAHDGISNLMKYALALDPFACGVANLPVPGKNSGYLTLTYRQNKNAPDLGFCVEAGDSLGGWTVANTVVSRVDVGDYWIVTVRDSVPVSSAPTRFMRLKVSR